MEAVIFCGIQATGKTTFFKERFFRTHVLISLDLLNTRLKEGRFLQTCFDVQQPFVVDNTNPTRVERNRYITPAKARGYRIVGYLFSSGLDEALLRNGARSATEVIPAIGLRGTHARMQMPQMEEGFDALYSVALADGNFVVQKIEE